MMCWDMTVHLGAIQVLRNAMRYSVWISVDQCCEGASSNVIGVTWAWGVSNFQEKNHYVSRNT